MHSQNAKYLSCKRSSAFVSVSYQSFSISSFLLDIFVDGFLSRHQKQADGSVQKWPDFMLLMLCLILFWHSIVFYITHIFLLGKRSGRSKKWREMLKLPPISHCEGIRCSIGRCPVEWFVWFFVCFFEKGRSLIILTEKILSCFWMLISKTSY